MFGFGSSQAVKRRGPRGSFDQLLLIGLIGLASVGVVMVTSSSIAVADYSHLGPFYYLKRDLLFLTCNDELAALTSELIAATTDEVRDVALSRAQTYDLLLQRLDGLSGLLAALGAGAPLDLALHALSLSDLSARLSGVASPRDPTADGGEVHLF